jgi:SAM-dependent methyltransferase
VRAGDPGVADVSRARWLPLALVALAALSLLSFTRPGKRAIRSLARWLDSHVEGFSEPNACGYARFVAPGLRRLYRRVTDDVAAELAARSGGASGDRGPDSDRGPGGREFAILDIGCGSGDLAALLARRLPEPRIVGLDLSPSMVDLARRLQTPDGRLRFELGDAASLPFESGAFDLVVSTLSLHHWPNTGAGFSEIRRVLRPGGVALVYDLRLLTVETETLPDVARRAGMPVSGLRRERLRGGMLAGLFVRIRVDRPVE